MAFSDAIAARSDDTEVGETRSGSAVIIGFGKPSLEFMVGLGFRKTQSPELIPTILHAQRQLLSRASQGAGAAASRVVPEISDAHFQKRNNAKKEGKCVLNRLAFA